MSAASVAVRERQMRSVHLVGGCLALMVVGCSSTLPPDRVADPRAALRAASEMGAQGNPRASLHLKLAQDQMARADALQKDGKAAEASWMLLRADADAELALVLTKQEKEQIEAQEIQTKIQSLKQKTMAP